MSSEGANGRANGAEPGDLKVLVKFPTVEGRGIDRKTLNKFLDEIEAIFYELELQELRKLLAMVDEKLAGDVDALSVWEWAKHAAYHKLVEAYAGRRFQIAGVHGDGLVLEIAVTAAAFGVLNEALARTKNRARLDGSRQGLLRAAEHSHGSSLVVLRDRFAKSEMFEAVLDDKGTQLVLSAMLEDKDFALPSMEEFVESARRNASFWHSLDLRSSLRF